MVKLNVKMYTII